MKRFMKYSLPVILFCLLSTGLFAEIRLPAIIADNMVLQQRSSDPVWGWAEPGQQITVTGSWDGSSVKTQAGENGKWMVSIHTPKAGGPYTLTIKGDETIVLKNVMIGEVWVCSGQSNMEMPVSGWPGASILNSAKEIAAADYPDIRLFTVKKKVAFAPQENCTGSWAECSPQTVQNFSATAYFFGRQLYKKLKVPIGLIHSSWGGTVAEAWTSNSALRKLGDFTQSLNTVDSIRDHLDEIRKKDEENAALWDQKSNYIHLPYAQTGFNDASWKTMQLPNQWENAGLPGMDGIVWFRKVVDIPASWAGKDLTLDLGPIDDEDITWFNGKEVGAIREEGFWAKPRSYTVPGSVVKAGKNTIAIRVTDLRGNGGIFGDKKSMQLYPANESSHQGIGLAGDWKYKVAVVKKPSNLGENPNTPSVLYNGMVAPLIPFGIRGAIWYQGEANVGRADQYAKLFPAMIADWRNRWGRGDFPFYFVQIAPYPYGGNGMKAAALRDAQRKSLRVPHSGMVVTLDIGDTTNIHPANKEEVGRRLSLWALNKTYGQSDVVYSGPLYNGMQVKGNKAIVSFTHTVGGLMTKGGRLTHFEIAGADAKFVPAKAAINGNEVVVQSDQVDHPVAVRYGWRDTSVPYLFNGAGLPASSFSTK